MYNSKNTVGLVSSQVKIQFTGKSITSYGGFALLAEFFSKIGLRDAVENILYIKEQSGNSMGVYSKVLSKILMVFAGGERFSHLPYLGGNEEVIKKLFCVDRLAKASSTLTRLFNKVTSSHKIKGIRVRLWDYFSKLIPWDAVGSDWLDADSTVLERYGEQEGALKGYNPRKPGRPSHHPLIAFLGKFRYVINLWNRPGNASAGGKAVEFLRESYYRIYDRIKVIGFRLDSGFYLKEVVKFIEYELGQKYIIAVRQYRCIQAEIHKVKDWKEIKKGIFVGEFMFKHKAEGWDKKRRYIVVRKDIKKHKKASGKKLQLELFEDEKLFKFNFDNYRYTVLLTNSEDDPEAIWEDYKPRAGRENSIKELKEDFALGGFCLNKFYATEAAMLIRTMIYNIFVLFRWQILAQKNNMQRLKTLRYKYFVIPAILGKSGRNDVLRLSIKGKRLWMKFLYLLNRINSYFPTDSMNCNVFN